MILVKVNVGLYFLPLERKYVSPFGLTVTLSIGSVPR